MQLSSRLLLSLENSGTKTSRSRSDGHVNDLRSCRVAERFSQATDRLVRRDRRTGSLNDDI